jgi:hypothetical protein
LPERLCDLIDDARHGRSRYYLAWKHLVGFLNEELGIR